MPNKSPKFLANYVNFRMAYWVSQNKDQLFRCRSWMSLVTGDVITNVSTDYMPG